MKKLRAPIFKIWHSLAKIIKKRNGIFLCNTFLLYHFLEILSVHSQAVSGTKDLLVLYHLLFILGNMLDILRGYTVWLVLIKIQKSVKIIRFNVYVIICINNNFLKLCFVWWGYSIGPKLLEICYLPPHFYGQRPIVCKRAGFATWFQQSGLCNMVSAEQTIDWSEFCWLRYPLRTAKHRQLFSLVKA